MGSNAGQGLQWLSRPDMATPRHAISRSVSSTAFAKLERSVEACHERVEKLSREIEVNIKRMAAMQAEIDHLRARMQ